MSLTTILVVVGLVGFAGVGVEGYLLKTAYEKQGALQQSNDAMAQRLKEINDVHKEMDKIHGTNNALPDDKLFDGLLPQAPGR